MTLLMCKYLYIFFCNKGTVGAAITSAPSHPLLLPRYNDIPGSNNGIPAAVLGSCGAMTALQQLFAAHCPRGFSLRAGRSMESPNRDVSGIRAFYARPKTLETKSFSKQIGA